ncbi:hypothetical protein R1flu_018445 [Riccia fluitans]|uniref:Integrase catalytic domain-containing protein n=1 Tax=Riccia fluitans TaxID=41844 RepID=A0ABD1ZGV8_9MARC
MYCEQEGITRHLTTFYTPEQNGVVERLNRTLLERARSMLSHSSLPPEFWAEVVNTAAYLVNLSPCSAVQLKTPFELWHKRIIERGGESSGSDIDKGESDPSGVEGEITHDINHDMPQGDLPAIAEDVSELEEHIEEQEGVGRPVGRPPNDDQLKSSVRRSARVKGAPQRYGVWFPSDQVDEHDNEDDVYVLITEEGEPSSFEEAHNSAKKAEWSTAMRKEMKSLNDNKTWELVELPKGKQVIACRWVYKRKEGSGTGEKIFKARLVGKGFTQRKGVDYIEVFAPIAKYSTIRLLLSLVCMFGLILDQMDVVTTFLYGLLDEEIFMRQPPGFARKGQESLVCKLLKSLYGLK